MKVEDALINTIVSKRLELMGIYHYLYVAKLDNGKTRTELFRADQTELMDDVEEYMFATMDMEMFEKELARIRKMHEAQILKNSMKST